MIAQVKILDELVKSQEEMFAMRFDVVLEDIEEQMKELESENTSLDTIISRLLPNINVYVDYVVRGYNSRIIELDRVDVLNSDDEHLPKAENSLLCALQNIVLELNEEAEQEYYSENAHKEYVMHDLYY